MTKPTQRVDREAAARFMWSDMIPLAVREWIETDRLGEWAGTVGAIVTHERCIALAELLAHHREQAIAGERAATVAYLRRDNYMGEAEWFARELANDIESGEHRIVRDERGEG